MPETWSALVELTTPKGKIRRVSPTFRVIKKEAEKVIKSYNYELGETACRVINLYGLTGLPSEIWNYPLSIRMIRRIRQRKHGKNLIDHGPKIQTRKIRVRKKRR